MAIGLATGIIAGVSAATSVAGGIAGAHAAKSAADTAAQGQIDAAKISAASQEKMYNQTRGDQLPYLTAGAGAAGRLDYLLGLPGPQTSTQGAYKAGYGPQGTSYIPSNGGAPVVAPATAPNGYTGYVPNAPASAYPTRQELQDYFSNQPPGTRGGGGSSAPIGGGKKYADDFAPGTQFLRGAYGPSSSATPVDYTADPNYGSLMKDFSAQDFQTDPGYAFRLSEGQKALDRSAAARGGLFSGETLKANDKYNQDFASNEYQNAYNRYQNNRTTKYNFLSNAAGGGQIAANNLGSIGAQYAGNIGQAYQTGYGNAANARASGYIGQANAWNGALTGVNNALGRI